MSEKLGASHPTRFTDSQWAALTHAAISKNCLVCDLLRAFADSLDEQQRLEYRLLHERFNRNENNVNSEHQQGDLL